MQVNKMENEAGNFQYFFLKLANVSTAAKNDIT